MKNFVFPFIKKKNICKNFFINKKTVFHFKLDISFKVIVPTTKLFFQNR